MVGVATTGRNTLKDLFMQVDTPAVPNYLARWGFFAKVHSSIVQRLAAWLGLHLYYVYAMPLMPSAGPDPDNNDYVLRIFVEGEAEALLARAKRLELDLNDSFVRNALKKGDVCNAILTNDEIVAFDWSAFTPTHVEDGVFVGFDARHRYGYFGYTLPEYRGRHLPRMFARLKERYCMEHGCTHTISYIAVDNRSSIQSSIAMGRHRIGLAGYLKLGSTFFAFADRAVRQSGFHFFLPATAPDLSGPTQRSPS